VDITTDTLITALRRGGTRVTRARRAICEVLAESDDAHLSAADVLERVEPLIGDTVDRSTVYRTLDVLEEAGLLHHVHLEHGPAVYHLADRARHHHFTCVQCGRVIDLPATEFADLASGLAAGHPISGQGLRFSVVGRCAACSRT
jgi:Fur family transcriptional regulator, ferric uptake regulator